MKNNNFDHVPIPQIHPSLMLSDHRKHTLDYYFMRKIILMNSLNALDTTMQAKWRMF